MNYFILVAGKGTRLNPLTYNYPKSLYKLSENTTVLSHLVKLIREADKKAKIFVIVGFLADQISQNVDGVTFIYNPFYFVTNSISSLWFAREYLKGECVVINGDVVVSKKLMKDIIAKPILKPSVLLDGSVKKDGDYNVQVHNDRVVAMSKGLKSYYGEFGGITLLDPTSSELLKQEIEVMVKDGHISQWYEDALVQMIFRKRFELYFIDISEYEWTEVDEVDDLVKAQAIYYKDR